MLGMRTEFFARFENLWPNSSSTRYRVYSKRGEIKAKSVLNVVFNAIEHSTNFFHLTVSLRNNGPPSSAHLPRKTADSEQCTETARPTHTTPHGPLQMNH
jgi:hypothetical protein